MTNLSSLLCGQCSLAGLLPGTGIGPQVTANSVAAILSASLRVFRSFLKERHLLRLWPGHTGWDHQRPGPILYLIVNARLPGLGGLLRRGMRNTRPSFTKFAPVWWNWNGIPFSTHCSRSERIHS